MQALKQILNREKEGEGRGERRGRVTSAFMEALRWPGQSLLHNSLWGIGQVLYLYGVAFLWNTGVLS